MFGAFILFGGDSRACGNVRFVHIEIIDVLDHDLHQEFPEVRTDGCVIRREPRLLIDSDEWARGTIFGFRTRLPRQTVYGLKAPKS